MIYPVKVTKFKNGKPIKTNEVSTKTLSKRHWKEGYEAPTAYNNKGKRGAYDESEVEE